MNMCRTIICVLFLAVSVLTMDLGKPVAGKKKILYDLNKAPEIFEQYIKDFNKSYKDDADKQEHYKAFVESLKTINRGNSNPDDTASYGLNDFADYTPEQRKFLHGGLAPRRE
ncbi:fruit bromelain-like [Aricia agestis]|uniref:fruit bromelain-like n=1 Tax=Aricia agestis TaxID=91739 RepID=UPI001C206D65|nr:fruit bromelain-like [Aricia agestis]